jgi:hypothetical protein
MRDNMNENLNWNWQIIFVSVFEKQKTETYMLQCAVEEENMSVQKMVNLER